MREDEAHRDRRSLTFDQKAAGAARYSKLVSSDARVQSRIRLGDIGNPQGAVVQHGHSASHDRKKVHQWSADVV